MSTNFEDEDIIGFLDMVGLLNINKDGDYYRTFIEQIVEPAKDMAKDEVLPIPNRERVLSVFSCIQRQLYPPIGIPKPDLEDIAVGILYNLIKNHYLDNGNKRIAGFLFYCFFINTNLKEKYSLEPLEPITKMQNTVVEIAKFNSSNVEEINEFITKVKTRLFVIKE